MCGILLIIIVEIGKKSIERFKEYNSDDLFSYTAIALWISEHKLAH
jgi:hypothetical protein